MDLKADESNAITLLFLDFPDAQKTQVINDLRKLFSRLRGDCGVDVAHWDVDLYENRKPADHGKIVTNLAREIWDPSCRVGRHFARSEIFETFIKANGRRCTSLASDWVDYLVDHRQLEDLHDLRRDDLIADVSKLLELDRRLRPEYGELSKIRRPNGLILGAEYRLSWGPAHGCSALGSREFYLCPLTYYPQILWHEALHAFFRVGDCYDPNTYEPTCDLANCIMQWEPSRCHTDTGKDWLCKARREEARQYTRQTSKKPN